MINSRFKKINEKILQFKTLGLLYDDFNHASILASCQALKYKPVDAREVSPDPKDRVRKNIEEGRGFRIMGGKKGGTFDFASSILCGELLWIRLILCLLCQLITVEE